MFRSPSPLWRSATTGIVLLGLLVALAGALIHFGDLRRWNQVIYDRLSTPVFERAPLADLVIITVDQPSLAELGRWPWPRQQHARLIDLLTQAGARAIAMDILFTEPDPSAPEGDQALVDAVRRSGRVVFPLAPERPANNAPMTLSGPFHALAAVASGLGHTDIELDRDGVVRTVFLKAGLDGANWPSFALSTALLTDRALDPSDDARPKLPLSGHQASRWVRSRPFLVPYAGASGKFPTISYADALKADQQARFRDKIVLVGMGAAGLEPRFATPSTTESEPMSGIEVQANILDGLRRGWQVSILGNGMTLALTAFLLALAVSGYWLLSRNGELLIFALAAGLTILMDTWLLATQHIWFDPAAALLTLALSAPLWSWLRLQLLTQRLVLERERSAATLNSIGDGVITADADGRVEYLNPVAENMVGMRSETARGKTLDEVLGASARRQTPADDDPTDANFQTPLFLTHPSGEARAVRINKSPIIIPHNRRAGLVLALSDITESWRISQELAHMATHDSLTGLPNRVLFMDRLDQAIIGAERDGANFAILFIDLDNFKKINDGLGHALGDLLLTEAAHRLRHSVRKRDTVARWGGDEFVVLLEGLTEAELAADIGQKILDVLAQPFDLDGPVYLSSSLGISLFPKDGNTPQELLAGADAAMYRVKKTGRNNLEFYACDMNLWAKERLELECEMRRGLEREEFELFFQPQVEPANGHIVAFEALLRWRHRERGLVLPGEFIGLAEETGIINSLGEWAIQSACRQVREWAERTALPVNVAVNLSPRQFMQKNLFEIIAAAVRENQLEPGRLTVEITESLMLNDLDHADAILGRLREEGVSIALDDFGTGFSSLAVLRRLPIDQIKIDKFFVKNVLANQKDAAIARHTVELAHALDMAVVAEGVETAAQLQFFRELGCDTVQGYFSGAPIPAADATHLLDETPRN